MPFNIGGYIYNGGQAITADYVNIITRGLLLHVDSTAPSSYLGSGTTWFDLKNSNNGTLVNGVSYSDSAIRLNGTNGYITLPTTGFAPSTLTLDFWIKCHEYKSSYFWVVDTLDNPELRFSIESGKARALLYDNGAYIADMVSSATISLNTWYYISLSVQNNDFRLYVNGILDTVDTSGAYDGTPSGNAGEHTLGTYNRPGAGYNGYANVSYGVYRFYNRVLAAAEILQNYNVQKSRFGL
jgi:hypothetical protein